MIQTADIVKGCRQFQVRKARSHVHPRYGRFSSETTETLGDVIIRHRQKSNTWRRC